MKPLPANRALDQYFLDVRSRLLDLAAALDRIDRGEHSETTYGDPRLERIRKSLEILLTEGSDRAERVQKLFSLDYDPSWARPKPHV